MKKIFTFIWLACALQISAQRAQVFTLGHDQLPNGAHNFNLYGVINSYGSNVAYSFVYSTDPTFSTSTTTSVQTQGFDSLTVVWATVDSLPAATTYYYYLATNTTNGPINGDTLHFYTDSTVSYYTIYGADVYAGQNGSAVSLNGILSDFTSTVTMYFQWGPMPDNLDSLVLSDAGTINDANTHNGRGSVFNGLNWGGLYFYRMMLVQTADTLYSDIRPFYIGMPFTVLNTLTATSPGATTATMNGQVQGFPVPLKLNVEYGPGYGNHHAPETYVANDTALYNYAYAAGGLQTNDQYNYRFRVESWLGNFYGNNGGDMLFTTGSKDSVFQTLAATNVVGTTVTLNGYADYINTQLVGGFEYGTSLAFGSYVIADTINDAMMHYPSATISGLLPSTTYYFVLRGGEYGDFSGTGPHLWGDTLQFTTGISGINTISANSDIAIYPNPVASQLTFVFGSSHDFKYAIIKNVEGQEISKTTISDGMRLDVTGLASGVYFIEILNYMNEPAKLLKFVKL